MGQRHRELSPVLLETERSTKQGGQRINRGRAGVGERG